MKSIYFSVFLFSIYSLTIAQVTDGTSKANIIKQIKALEDLETKAILEADTMALKNLWENDYRVYNPYDRIFDKNQVLQGIKSTFITFSSFVREQEYYGVYDDVVFVMGKETVVFSGKNPDKGKELLIRYTDVYKLIDGSWKIIARHANIIK
ncbi:MAG: nuclear transport factor 2 family protein [Ignavibacteriota bacterium]